MSENAFSDRQEAKTQDFKNYINEKVQQDTGFRR